MQLSNSDTVIEYDACIVMQLSNSDDAAVIE